MGVDHPPALLDTSVVVRYLTDDPPEMAAAAAALVDGERALGIVPLILAESAYVLTSVYGIPRDAVAGALADLLLRRNISCPGLPKPLAVEALRLAGRSSRVSFADALLWAAARHGGAAVATFDDSFPDDGIEIAGPAAR